MHAPCRWDGIPCVRTWAIPCPVTDAPIPPPCSNPPPPSTAHNHFLQSLSLTQEILDFEHYVYKAQCSWDVGINRVVSGIRSIVSRIWRDATVEAFGSFASGLWLPNSDVDLVIKVCASVQSVCLSVCPPVCRL